MRNEESVIENPMIGAMDDYNSTDGLEEFFELSIDEELLCKIEASQLVSGKSAYSFLSDKYYFLEKLHTTKDEALKEVKLEKVVGDERTTILTNC